ncbi:hypothetical protein Lal_00038652 [Lupinus albus]|nr:hypothetical protein Lal_00038652 [Lupinus albus]
MAQSEFDSELRNSKTRYWAEFGLFGPDDENSWCYKKKLHEINTLCGIQAYATIYGPNETRPDVWPSHSEVQMVINRFIAMFEIENRKNMSTQESF